MPLAADYVYEDEIGDLWMLAYSPIDGLVKYDRQAERFTSTRLARVRGAGLDDSRLGQRRFG